MSRLKTYESDLKDAGAHWSSMEHMMAFMFNGINVSLALIADRLEQVEKGQREIIRELGKRK